MKITAVVIDGPAGVGKSTIAKNVAKALHLTYIDTGAMYRTITLYALEEGIPIDVQHQAELLATIEKEDFSFSFEAENLRIFHGSRDITEAIRSQQVTELVSQVAALPIVRSGLLAIQRKLAENNNVVMEGRDIGTVVLPGAKYKFFLTAAPEIRAQRRYEELKSKGLDIDLSSVLADIKRRDRLDSTREVAPLRKPDDAIEVDTSGLSIEEVTGLLLVNINALCHGQENGI